MSGPAWWQLVGFVAGGFGSGVIFIALALRAEHRERKKKEPPP